MHVSLSSTVPDVPPAEALRWWSDFQDGGHDHRFVPGADRRVVQKDAHSATMEETTRWLGIRVFREGVTAQIGHRDVRFTGTNDFACFDGAYTFEPEGAGTRITLTANIRLKPALRWSDVAAKPLVLAILNADLRGHAKDMRRDLRGK